MIVAVDTNCVIPGSVGGLENYVISLVSSLANHARWVDRLILLTREENQDLFAARFGRRCETLPVPRPTLDGRPIRNWSQVMKDRPDRGRRALEEYQRNKLRAIERCGADVVHFPGNAINPIDLDVPAVLNVHDLQHRHYPQYFTPTERDNRESWWSASARRADAVLASTRFVAADLRREWGLSESKLVVAHPPVDPFFLQPPDAADLRDFRRRMQMGRTVFIYPASDWPHKNHRRLLEAMNTLEIPDAQLFLTGFSPGRSSLPKTVESMGLRDCVRMLGRVSREDLRRLYHCATAVVLPSEFEASSFPLMEAMACGCPVAASNVTGLPELIGDCGLIFDPADVASITAAMRRLAVDDHLRDRLAEAGRARSRGFGPALFVQGLLDAYLLALSNRKMRRAA